jgi:hypothetical protein
VAIYKPFILFNLGRPRPNSWVFYYIIKENGELYNNEIIRKIFDMMESFAQRIVDMEKKTNDINEK